MITKMTIAIEDEQLETELQELYLTGKQWLSDTNFMENELIFLTGLVKDLPNDGQAAFRPLMDSIRTDNEKLRAGAVALMHKLQPLIVKKDICLDRSLVDNFINLQRAAANTLKELKSLKYRVVRTRHGLTKNLPF